MEHIDSLTHPTARRITDTLAGSTGLIIIDDEINIDQALRSGVELAAIITTAEEKPQLIDATKVPTYTLAVHVAKEIFGREKRTRTFALATAPTPATFADITAGDIVVLDGVRLAGNIGAIIRTACALGAAGVILVGSGIENVWDRRLIRSSRGLVFALPVLLATPDEVADYVDARNIPMVGLTADADEQITSINGIDGDLALLMGSERHGFSAALKKHSARSFAIPISAGVESLNVSVATALALWEHRR